MDIRSHVISLNETRARVNSEAQAFLDRIYAQKREMTAEENAQWQRYNDRIDEIDAEVKQFVDRETRERSAAESREAFERMYGAGSHAAAERNEGALIRSFLRGEQGAGTPDPETGRPVLRLPMGAAAKEAELLRQGASPYEARALAWDTGSIASAVPVSMARSCYGYLERSNSMWRAPTTKINTSSGEAFQFPRFAAHGIGTQVSGQGTALAGTDPTFDRMQLDAFKYGQLIRVSNEVVTDTAVDIADLLGRDIGRALGRVIATDLVTGSGSGKPRGLMTALAGGGAGSITTGGSLIDPTYEKLVDLRYSLVDEYRNGGSVGWMMHDLTAANIRKLRDGAGGTVGAAMWVPSLTNGIQGAEPDLLLGDPVYHDSNIASLASNARIMTYVDFSAYYIRHVQDVVIERDDSVYFATDEVAFRGKWRLDGDLIDVNAGVTMVRNV